MSSCSLFPHFMHKVRISLRASRAHSAGIGSRMSAYYKPTSLFSPQDSSTCHQPRLCFSRQSYFLTISGSRSATAESALWRFVLFGVLRLVIGTLNCAVFDGKLYHILLLSSCVAYTGVGQNNGNIIDTLHVSLLIWYWDIFCLQYSRNPSWNGLVQVLNSL
jgi:hypothetical protein